jgi:hypothetical protein
MHEPECFSLLCPVFLVLEKQINSQPEFISLIKRHFVMPAIETSGGNVVPVFTSEDAAQGFGEALNNPACVVARVNLKSLLVDILQQAKYLEFSYVALNPSAQGFPKQLRSIDEVLDGLRTDADDK